MELFFNLSKKDIKKTVIIIIINNYPTKGYIS